MGCKTALCHALKTLDQRTTKKGTQYNEKLVDIGLATLFPQLQGFLGRVRGFTSVGCFVSGDEIQRLCEQGQLDQALDVLSRMDDQGIAPPVHIYGRLMKVCAKRKALTQAKQMRAHLAKHGLQDSRFLGESMVSTLVSCGSLIDALEVFYSLRYQTAFSWTALISGYTASGQAQEALGLYHRMQERGVEPNAYTFVHVLKACGSMLNLIEGKRIHSDVSKHGLEHDVFVGTCLLDMYGKCGSIVDAYDVFSKLARRDVVSWNAMLATFVQHGQAEKALQLYERMQQEGVSLNDRTFVSVLQACGMLAEEEEGGADGQSVKVKSLERAKLIHGAARRKGYHADVFVGSTLVSMYGKCGSIVDARDVFYGLDHRNVVLWNAMLTAYVERNQPEDALQLYENMKVKAVHPNDRTFVSVLQACTMVADKEEAVVVCGESMKVLSLRHGIAIHHDAKRRKYDSDVFVGSALIHFYGKCGSIEDAQNVFLGLSMKDVVSWNSMMAAYTHQGLPDKALLVYDQMLNEGVRPNIRTFVSSLHACGMTAEHEAAISEPLVKLKSLERGRAIHADATREGCDLDIFVGNTLMSMYGKLGSVADAERVFEKLSKRDVVSWNTMLAAFVDDGRAEMVLQLYDQMNREGVNPDVRTLVTALQACGILAEKNKDIQLLETRPVEIGRRIHADARDKGYDSDVYVSNTLVSMYGKCGSIEEAQNVFDGLSQRHLVSWNAMLAAYIEEGKTEKAWYLYRQMQEHPVSPDVRTFVSILQACGILAEKEEALTKGKYLIMGKSIHADTQAKGCDSDLFVGSALISMYRKCGSILDARNAFDQMRCRDVVAWNVMLMGYVETGDAENALQLYNKMRGEDVNPNVRTFLTVIQACAILAEKNMNVGLSKLKALEKGKAVHADAQDKGFDSDVFVASALVSMYGKCGSMPDARNAFGSAPQSDVVLWNAMLGAYCQLGLGEDALQLYRLMEQHRVSPDAWTFVSVLQACGLLAEKEERCEESLKLKSLSEGRAIHKEAQRKGHDSDVFVSTTLISMYGKCGSIQEAQNVFDGLSQRSVASWNAMLAAYAQGGQGEDALQLWRQMQEQSVSADEITLVCLLQACSTSGSLALLRHIHDTLVPNQNKLGPLLASAIVSAYGRCASMEDARTVFRSLINPDVVSWNALIAGYAKEGSYRASLDCYEEMLVAGMKPNEVTFMSLLSVCSHGGLVDEGVELFESMSKDYGLTPEVEHYAAVVDLFGRAGCFRRVEEFLSIMPLQPDLGIWLCLLSACQKYGMVELGKQAFDNALLLQPGDSAAYVLMSNIYADAGFWDHAKEIHACRQQEGARKKPGQSWIVLEDVHAFTVGDDSHLYQAQFCDLLEQITVPRLDERVYLPHQWKE